MSSFVCNLGINIEQIISKDYTKTKTMLLDIHKISLIYDFWKLNNEENYLHDATELSRKLTESDTIDGEFCINLFYIYIY